jgi:hypothetical protein
MCQYKITSWSINLGGIWNKLLLLISFLTTRRKNLTLSFYLQLKLFQVLLNHIFSIFPRTSPKIRYKIYPNCLIKPTIKLSGQKLLYVKFQPSFSLHVNLKAFDEKTNRKGSKYFIVATSIPFGLNWVQFAWWISCPLLSDCGEALHYSYFFIWP